MTATPKIKALWAPLMAVALLAVLVIACAPASGGTVGDAGANANAGADATGVEVGDISPPFAMQLTDGSEVTLKNLVDDQQPILMMYFATW